MQTMCDKSTGGLIEFAFPGLPWIGCAFTTALAGSLVATQPGTSRQQEETTANRNAILQKIGLDAWVELKQVHGDGFITNPAPTPLDTAHPLQEADGASTARKGLALLIKTADCQPVLLTDIKGSAVAALHVGWRGNRINFPASGVHAFCAAFSLEPSEILAVRGPSLGRAEFVNFEQEWTPDFQPWFDQEHRTMDLWSLTRDQLQQAGLRPGNIFSLDLCTWSLPHLFYSHRRGHAGRQGSLIWIKND